MSAVPRALPRPRVTESAYQDLVADYLRLHKFKVFHARPAQTGRGWKTPVQYDGKGFVDLLCVGHGRVIAIEIKVGRGRLTAEQTEWAEAFLDLDDKVGAYWHLTPEGWDGFVKWLKWWLE